MHHGTFATSPAVLPRFARLKLICGSVTAKGLAITFNAKLICCQICQDKTKRLIRNSKDVRMVTTNFDKHFSTAASEQFDSSVEIYRAPALPLGGNFKGIVYLHGCVDQQPEELILTDADFGRVYLTDGWATRFLPAMFATHAVLFVGYSHNDPIMHYLSRGLPPNTLRYALVQTGNDEHWNMLGIIPIPYRLKRAKNKHRLLVEAVSTWAQRTKMGYLDHERRIKTIVDSSPPRELDVADYMVSALKDFSLAQFFTRHARTVEWLRWAEGKGAFRTLFNPGEQNTDLDQTFAGWFAENYVCQQPEEALGLVERQGQVLSPTLWQKIAWHLSTCNPRPDAGILAKWVIVLLHSVPRRALQNTPDLSAKTPKLSRYILAKTR